MPAIDEMIRHQYYLARAARVAQRSPDPSTKVGAVLVQHTVSAFDKSDLEQGVLAENWNDFPTGVLGTPERWADRTIKYSYVVHAERRLFLSMLQDRCQTHRNTAPMDRSILYIHGLPPCGDCAGDIIMAGVRNVVYADLEHLPEKRDTFRRWHDSSSVGATKFREGGVRVLAVRPEFDFDIDLALAKRVDRKEEV